MSTTLPLVVAITGASGAPYAVRLLQALAASGQPTWLIVSDHGLRLLETETGIRSVDELRERVGGNRWDAVVRTWRVAGVGIGANQRHGNLPVLDGNDRRDFAGDVAIAG
jgi:hypothetical protein